MACVAWASVFGIDSNDYAALVVTSIVLGIAGADDLTKPRKTGLRICFFIIQVVIAIKPARSLKFFEYSNLADDCMWRAGETD